MRHRESRCNFFFSRKLVRKPENIRCVTVSPDRKIFFDQKFFMMLIAYFLLVILPDQSWPQLLGPYTQEECHTTLEFLVRRNVEVSGCELLPLPQPDAVVFIQPGQL